MAIEPEEEHPPLEEDEGGPVKSFLEHLEDLRWVLIKSISTLAIAMLICMIGGNYVIAILKRPLEKAQVRYASDDKIAVVRYGDLRIGTYSLTLDQWDTINANPTNKTPWRIATNEMVDLKSLAARLEEPKDDEVSQYLASQLSPASHLALTNFDTALKGSNLWHRLFPTPAESALIQNSSAELAGTLADDFNRLIEGGQLYDKKRFENVKLSPTTLSLLNQNQSGEDLMKLNRKLLLQAFPAELSSGGGRFAVVQLEPVSDGAHMVLGMRMDKTVDAEAMAKHMTVDLNTLSPAGGFFVAFQVAIYAGIAVSSPLLFYFICQFVFPALKWKEKKYIYRGLLFFVPLFLIGASFCYFILLPVALAASQIYSNWLGLSANIWRAEEYISFVAKFILGMGLGFEMPVVILVLVKIGILNYTMLSKGRRYMILINLVLGAVLTTPEVVTQVLMAVPLQLLYEISVWVAWYWERQEKKKAAAAETED